MIGDNILKIFLLKSTKYRKAVRTPETKRNRKGNCHNFVNST